MRNTRKTQVIIETFHVVYFNKYKKSNITWYHI